MHSLEYTNNRVIYELLQYLADMLSFSKEEKEERRSYI